MPDTIPHFVALLSLGIAGFGWAFRDHERRLGIVPAYFRILMLVLLGLGVVLALTAPREAVLIPASVAPLAFLGSILWLLERRSTGHGLFLICGVALLIWLGNFTRAYAAESGVSVLLLGLSQLTSAATLGVTLCAMLLGHRYLTAPGMPLLALTEVNQNLGVVAAARCFASIVCLYFGWRLLTEPVQVIWLSLRWLAGVIGPLVVWYMVRRILVYRNTQAATGVLFVGVILTFIGELTADLLLRATGAPF